MQAPPVLSTRLLTRVGGLKAMIFITRQGLKGFIAYEVGSIYKAKRWPLFFDKRWVKGSLGIDSKVVSAIATQTKMSHIK